MSTGTGSWSTKVEGARALPWAQVDVFAERVLEGNMLAIFTDARGLTDEEMQALARETNLSETTFILPADDATEREEGVRVRIFTTEEELPFAGHPTLGTASWLWANHPTLRGAEEIRLKLNVGTIPVRFKTPLPGEQGVYGEMRQRDPEFGVNLDPVAIAEGCGLSTDDLHPALKPQVVSTGLPFAVVPLRSVEALGRLRVQPAMADLLAKNGARFVYAIAPTEDAARWRARMQFHGVEDPATGSAAGCSISYLVLHGAVPSATSIVMEQGVEMKRPSIIRLQATKNESHVTDVFVAGCTISVASGLFTLL